MCVCVNAYLNIPHPKLCKACLYKLGRGNKGGRMRKKSDKVLEGGRERESERKKVCVWGGAKRGKKDFLTLQLLLRQPAWQYIQPLPQWHEGIRWINPLLFPLQKRALAMWKPHRPSPLFCFQLGHYSLSLPLSIHSRKKKERERDKNDPVS